MSLLSQRRLTSHKKSAHQFPGALRSKLSILLWILSLCFGSESTTSAQPAPPPPPLAWPESTPRILSSDFFQSNSKQNGLPLPPQVPEVGLQIWSSSGLEWGVNLGSLTPENYNPSGNFNVMRWAHPDLGVSDPWIVFIENLPLLSSTRSLIPFNKMESSFFSVNWDSEALILASGWTFGEYDRMLWISSTRVSISDALNRGPRNLYAFAAVEGQRLNMEIIAARLGSGLDSTLKILDIHGAWMAFNDDDPTLGKDSRLSWVAPKNGLYFLEVRDVEYQEGKQFSYQLRLGDFPLVHLSYPSSVTALEEFPSDTDLPQDPQSTQTNVDFSKVLTPEVSGNLPFLCYENEEFSVLKLSGHSSGITGASGQILRQARFPSGSDFSTTIQNVTKTPVIIELPSAEIDTNSDFNWNRQPITVDPGTNKILNGFFAQAGEIDRYNVVLKKDQPFWAQGFTRPLGSPCDLYLRLYRKSDRLLLAESDPNNVEETALSYTLSESDSIEAQLEVQEIADQFGRHLIYEVLVSGMAPLKLEILQDRFTGAPGTVISGEVKVVSGDLPQDWEIVCHGCPDGVSFRFGELSGEKEDRKIPVFWDVSETAAPGSFSMIQLELRQKSWEHGAPVMISKDLSKPYAEALTQLPRSIQQSCYLLVTHPNQPDSTNLLQPQNPAIPQP